MLDRERVRALFGLFTDLPDDRLNLWEGLCDNAVGSLMGRLRENVNLPANMERLCTAAAAMAYADYLLLDAGGVGASDEIRVGDITLKKSSSDEKNSDSREIWEYFLGQIGDLLADSAVVFAAVGGARK